MGAVGWAFMVARGWGGSLLNAYGVYHDTTHLQDDLYIWRVPVL